MSNGKRGRRFPEAEGPRQLTGGPPRIQAQGQGLPEVIEQLLDDVSADLRVLYSGHPALGGLVIDMVPETSAPGTARSDAASVPIALIEPVRTGKVPPTVPGGSSYDVRTAIAAKLGLPVLTAQLRAPLTAAHWTLEYGPTSCVLADPTGSALARCRADNQANWRDLAKRLSKVVVIYGPSIGVRRPSGTPADRYDDTARAIELSHARATGIANWGIVRFVTI